MTRWQRLFLFVGSAFRLLLALALPKVPAFVAKQRRQSCEKCLLRDSEGQRLYRKSGVWRTCGVVFWKKPDRDDKRDGCGCLLQLKWRGAGQQCQAGRWD